MSRKSPVNSYMRDIAWMSCGSATSGLIGILVMPIVSRIYTPSQFASANLILLISGFMAVIVTFRVEQLIQLPTRAKEAWLLVRAVFFISVVSTLLLSPILYIQRKPLAILFGDQDLAQWLAFSPFIAAGMGISVAMGGWVQRGRGFRRSALASISEKFGYSAVVFSGPWLLPGSGGLVLAGIGSSIGMLVVLRPKKKWKLVGGLKGVFLVVKRYAKLSAGLIYSHVLLSISMLLPAVYIVRHYGSDDLGQYALVSQALALPGSIIGRPINTVFYQRSAEMWSAGRSYKSLFLNTINKIIYISVPVFGLIAALSPLFFPLIFGGSWVKAGSFAVILSIGHFFSFINSPMDRGSHVVNAWWHYPCWQTVRLVTIGTVFSIASYFSLQIESFLWLLSAQMAVVALYDVYFQWRFSCWVPLSKEVVKLKF